MEVWSLEVWKCGSAEVLKCGNVEVRTSGKMEMSLYLTHICLDLVVWKTTPFSLTSSSTSKNVWALSHEFKLVPFSACSCVIQNEWCRFHSVMFISVENFCHAKWILSQSVLWNSQIKIIKLSLVHKVCGKWYNKWIITQGAGTPNVSLDC